MYLCSALLRDSSSIYSALTMAMALWAGDTHSSLHLTYEKGNIIFKQQQQQHMRPVKDKEVK